MTRKSSRHRREDKRAWIFLGALIVLLVVIGLVAWLIGDGHPRPERQVYELPADAVVVYDQQDEKVKLDFLEVYQNSSPDFEYLPFDFYVSPSTLMALEEYLLNEDILGNSYRFVIHWPGDPTGSEALCEDTYTGIIRLELAREVYERVYLPYFADKDLDDPSIQEDFLIMAESQINYSLYHEAAHIGHCADSGIGRNDAEKEARKAESELTALLGHVIFIRIQDGKSLQEAMEYVGGLRNP